MGTNYYLESNACPTCGKPEKEPLQIGKSSAGWCFALHVIPEEHLNSLDDWKAMFAMPGTRIVDEYGAVIPVDEMVKRITERSWPRKPDHTFNYEGNYAEPGPNGLVRHKIGQYCVGHGEGTWDLIPGYFS